MIGEETGKDLSQHLMEYIFTKTERSQKVHDKETDPIVRAKQILIEEELLARIKACAERK